MSTKYTFLLPAYKATFLAEALESIKSQTYSDFKVIVSDDYSPENLKSIYDSVCWDDPRFSYRRNAENMGGKSLVSHWNMLVDICDSEYLVMASDDDVYGANFLEEIDKLIDKYPSVDVLRAKAKRVENGIVASVDGEIHEYMSLGDFLPYFGKKHMIHCLANYVFRTSTLKNNGLFPDFPKAGYSDAAATMRLAVNGIAITKDVLFSFRISTENLSSGNGYEKYKEDGICGVVQFEDWYKENIAPLIIQYNNRAEIQSAHYHHVIDIAQFFLCRLSLGKSMYYYWQLRKRGYFNIHSTLTAIKNWVLVRKH